MPLSATNFSFANRVCRLKQRFILFGNRVSGLIPKFQMRTTNRTSIWLRVKATIERIVIFALAFRTHRELFHRSVGAVVGQCFDDRETRAAIGAIREWVAKSPIVWIKNFAQAIRTRCNVWKNQCSFLAAIVGFANFESVITDRIEKRGFQTLDNGACRSLFFQPPQECSERIAFAFYFDENTLRGIQNPAIQFELSRKPINERTEADALNGTAHRDS